MKAAVINAPNTEVRIEERERPSPGRGEVLIRVHACGVCHGDLMLQLGQFPFARYPIVPGHEIAGVIVDSVRCGSDVGKGLVGRTMPNENVAVIEERHRDLGLKDLGGTDISDRLFLISWQICGEEYALLEGKDVVKDVLKFPKHSKDSPAFIGSCQLNGHDVPGTAIGVLKNKNGVEMLPAVIAWKIDDKQKKFVMLQAEGLHCSRDGIISADGGL